MIDEFKDGIEWLERHYDWRDQYTRDDKEYNCGWFPNVVPPGYALCFSDETAGQHDKNGNEYLRYVEVYRHDLFQMEDSLRGNSDCAYTDKAPVCQCYMWPGEVHSMEWTEEDEKLWLEGFYYPYPESGLRDRRLSLHIQEKYGFHPFDRLFNKIEAVIREDDNGSSKAKGSDAPYAAGQRDTSEESCPHDGARALQERLSRLSGAPSGHAERER